MQERADISRIFGNSENLLHFHGKIICCLFTFSALYDWSEMQDPLIIKSFLHIWTKYKLK